jgi:hypothetical protein
MPFPPYPASPSPFTWLKGDFADAAKLRSDVVNAVTLLTAPPLFSGSQTGVPAAFTADSVSDTFTAGGTAYTAGQTVVLSGGSLPTGVTAGTVYFITAPSDTQFQLTATSGGAPVNITTNGSGTVQQVQVASTGIWSPVTLDTEASDAWASHLATANASQSFAMFPGFCLAESTAPLNYSGGTGSVSAGIIALEGTGAVTIHGGQRVKTSGTATRFAQPSAAKLLAFSVTGSNTGAGGNNFAQAGVYHDSGADRTLLATGTRYPGLQLEWVSALDGNPALPVPDNDAWPVPPEVLGRTFLNKNVRDTLSFLAFRPVMEAYYAAGTFSLASQSSLPSVGTAVPLDTAYADTRSAFNASTGVWTAPCPGVYGVYGQVPVTSATTSTAVAAGLTVTSASYGGSAVTMWGPPQAAFTTAGQVNCALAQRRLRLNAGDTIALAGFQANSSSAAAVIPAGTWKARLIAVWRST